MIRFTPGGKCEICGEKTENLECCSMCGSMICNNCTAEEICLACLETRCSICGEYLSARACSLCGRLVCETHGEKEGEATICDACKVS
ncbi:MAG: hypothetical protein EAX81_01855 [Candidatus Thorarchaeota archaeon]|nr:hypothetical protein [Candidatus Thorarchaeota archaeon]